MNFIYLIDTPGFENENKTKPEETQIISAGAGLAKPDDMADQILSDSLVNTIFIYLLQEVPKAI